MADVPLDIRTQQPDTSFYPHAVSPLDQAGKAAGLIGQLNQNQLFKQQFQTNLGLSKIYQQAIDPNTGQIDMDKVRALAGSDPSITLGLPQAVQQSQAMQAQQLGIEQSKIDLVHKRFGLWSAQLGPIMSMENPTQKDVMSAAGSLVSSGSFPAQEVIRTLTDPNDPLPSDGPGIKAWVQRHYVRGLQEQQQIQMMFGSPAPVSTGQQTVIQSTSPLGGTRTYGAFQNQPGPETKVYNPASGQMEYLGAGQGGGQGGNGRFPQGQGTPSTGSAGLQAEPPLGIPEARSAAATGSGAMLNSARSDVANSGGRIFILQKALQGLQGSPTGPGTESVNNFKSFLLAQDPTGLAKLGIDPNKIKSYDEAQKYLTQFAMSQAGSLGQGTDEKLATALTGNASTHISNMAAQDVVKANIGLERMKQAQLDAFDAENGKPEDYSKFAAKWGRTIDPRAFVVDQMTPKERGSMIAGMKPSERTKFLNTLRTALSTGSLSMADIKAGNGQ